jgi:hypothetical protein
LLATPRPRAAPSSASTPQRAAATPARPDPAASRFASAYAAAALARHHPRDRAPLRQAAAHRRRDKPCFRRPIPVPYCAPRVTSAAPLRSRTPARQAARLAQLTNRRAWTQGERDQAEVLHLSMIDSGAVLDCGVSASVAWIRAGSCARVTRLRCFLVLVRSGSSRSAS